MKVLTIEEVCGCGASITLRAENEAATFDNYETRYFLSSWRDSHVCAQRPVKPDVQIVAHTTGELVTAGQ